MLRLLFTIILPFCILIVPIVLLYAYHKTTKAKNKKDFIVVTICCILIGLMTPILSMMISIYGFKMLDGTPDPYCLTGVGSFLIFGYLITFFGIPITCIILFPGKTTQG